MTAGFQLAELGFDIGPVSQRSQYFNFCIYGEPGVGKTRLAASADDVPEMRPVLFIDMEGGTESIRKHHPDVQVARVKSWSEMQKLYNALCDTDHGFQTVVIDSLSEAQKFNMNHIMKEVAASNSNMTEEVPSMREWGISLEQMRKFVRGFRDLELHTIFTCLPVRDRDIRTGKFTYDLMLSGKLAKDIPGFVDEVFYMFVKEVVNDDDEEELKRVLLTGKTETIIAKDRSGSLPLLIQEPSMAKLYEQMTK